MNDESITSSSPSSPALPGRVARFFRRMGGLLRREPDGARGASAPRKPPHSEREAPPDALLAKARAEISAYTSENWDILERAKRFQRRYERLEGEGNPSESVGNRAERARSDFRQGLDALRERFASTHGEEGRRAFDLEAAGLLTD